ncbi:MAG: type II toxin-antitoxin system VapB family antitoxin [Fidelibacterota bacterium]
MRTTLDIDGELLELAMKLTKSKTKKAVIEKGLYEIIAKAKVDDFMAAIGSVPDFDLNTETIREWRDQEETIIETGQLNEPPVS